MSEKNRTLTIVILMILAIIFFNSQLFTIYLSSPKVQYNNKPITAEFKLSNYTNPLITAFFENKEIFEINANETNETITFDKNLINNTHQLTIHGIKQEGTFKFVVSEGNLSEVELIEIRNPFVDINHNIPGAIDEGESFKIDIKTFNPQGEVLIADDIGVTVSTPDNEVKDIEFTKSENLFYATFNYKDDGNYIFKIKPSKSGFDTKEFTAITSVIETGGIHPIVWIWILAIVFWLILFGIKFARTRL